ncbi:MAG TPA: DUF4920 domain-containing protein [Bryobacteraceae bacterium]|jgi:hypothetical protein|nr:DUF4920 domain-containing protein [Bryobacteraceae bacterium]
MKILADVVVRTAFGLSCLAALATAADLKLGAPLSTKEAMPLATLFAGPAPYVGKTVQVKGKVTEVCEAMGCWMNLTDDQGHLLRISVEDGGEISFPKDSVGKTAVAEGKLEKNEMTRAQVVAAAKEEAAEGGRKFNPSKIKSGKTVYQLSGTGAVIFDN